MKKILLITIGLSVILLGGFSRSGGVVTDSATLLEWQDDYSDNSDSIKFTDWTDAIAYCEGLSLEGGDWRLPNINELVSLVDDTQSNPAISSVFQNSASNYYWSSTTYTNSSNKVWGVGFSSGGQGNDYKDHNYFVRCVRTGQ